MRIPGRLKDTTLGDVLGTLHRAEATGTLELHELGESAGRVHRIRFDQGVIAELDSVLGPRLGTLLSLDPDTSRKSDDIRSGEAWISRGLVSPDALRGALRLQLQRRLDTLFQLRDAELRFRIPRPRAEDPTAPRPLERDEFLRGRPRRRGDTTPNERPPAVGRALRVLGLDSSATREDIQRAFRRLAQDAHPDRHPNASASERAELFERFAELSRAYHELTA